MATRAEFIDYVLEQAGLGPRLSARKMFGEYALYLDAKVVGLVCDGSVYVKPLAATQARVIDLPMQPPYPGAKPHPVADALLDAPEVLRALLEQTAHALPPPKPRAPRPRRKS